MEPSLGTNILDIIKIDIDNASIEVLLAERTRLEQILEFDIEPKAKQTAYSFLQSMYKAVLSQIESRIVAKQRQIEVEVKKPNYRRLAENDLLDLYVTHLINSEMCSTYNEAIDYINKMPPADAIKILLEINNLGALYEDVKLVYRISSGKEL